MNDYLQKKIKISRFRNNVFFWLSRVHFHMINATVFLKLEIVFDDLAMHLIHFAQSHNFKVLDFTYSFKTTTLFCLLYMFI